MNKHIRIPGLVSLVKIDDPDLILQLNAHPSIDRNVAPSGPLLNRRLPQAIRRNLDFGGVLSPVIRARDDEGRAALSAALYRQFAEPQLYESPEWRRCVAMLGQWLRSQEEEAVAGVALQQLIGGILVPGYQADRAGWDAAVAFDREIRAVSPVARLRQRLTGTLEHARATLMARAKGNVAAVHGTGVAIHNFIASLRLLRALKQTEAFLSGEDAARRSRKAPKTVLRQVSEALDVPSIGRLERGTLILFALDEAQSQTGDLRIAFLEGSWSACPATQFSVRLMEASWEAAG
ncbi:MAG TPA: hypothetical protein VN112_15700 [Ensifer sp.]|nr:hypothetical protein [Ensifer sp.]